ncbi:unnamed protein product [Sphenostylis stenocarpa]|uniref:Uncharacterized protein n=1 Tax=Sphenostylis stenocarpa TaxID=92480 RepID=A0AA86S5Y6_9FABA|nr:unnamed protein product [Sphenostylis stenocarpa]
MGCKSRKITESEWISFWKIRLFVQPKRHVETQGGKLWSEVDGTLFHNGDQRLYLTMAPVSPLFLLAGFKVMAYGLHPLSVVGINMNSRSPHMEALYVSNPKPQKPSSIETLSFSFPLPHLSTCQDLKEKVVRALRAHSVFDKEVCTCEGRHGRVNPSHQWRMMDDLMVLTPQTLTTARTGSTASIHWEMDKGRRYGRQHGGGPDVGLGLKKGDTNCGEMW